MRAKDKLNVITICGSLRKASYNATLARMLPKLAPPGMAIAPGPPFDAIPHYNEDVQNLSGFPDTLTRFAEAIHTADGVIIVSPEHNWSVPGSLKNAIDWVSRMKDHALVNKPVALQSASDSLLGGARMQGHLRQALSSINALVLVRPEVFVNQVASKVDPTTLELKDQRTIEIVKQQLARFEQFIRRFGGSW